MGSCSPPGRGLTAAWQGDAFAEAALDGAAPHQARVIPAGRRRRASRAACGIPVLLMPALAGMSARSTPAFALPAALSRRAVQNSLPQPQRPQRQISASRPAWRGPALTARAAGIGFSLQGIDLTSPVVLVLALLSALIFGFIVINTLKLFFTTDYDYTELELEEQKRGGNLGYLPPGVTRKDPPPRIGLGINPRARAALPKEKSSET
mmetsp:Transcript_62017/g.134489  ORF Transcript_62017/g.134489 Transcript_62017/m.134489 type:complete len:208 (-) Transcript_62017:93-716(-)